MKSLHIQILISALLLTAGTLHAQKRWTVEYEPRQSVKIIPQSFSSREEAMTSVMSAYGQMLAEGFLDAVIDTTQNDSVIFAKVNRGQQYTIRRFNWQTDSLMKTTQEAVNFRRPGPLSTTQINKQASSLLGDYENRGFPFASVGIHDIQIEGGQADITFSIEKGPRIVMDSVIVKSNTKLPVRYVRNYLDFRKGDLYSEEKLLRVEKKLREIPFVALRQSPEVRFNPGEADLFLFLEKKKSNYFNGIVGVRPDDQTGKINITGDAEIKLLNAFNGGEELYLNWRKLQAETQDLTIKTMLPYVLNTPVGVDGMLKIYKRDSTFSSVKTLAGIVFNFGGNNKLKVFAEKNTTDQLSNYSTAQTLANVNSTLYGLSFQIEKLDYKFNPRRGISLLLEGATGSRKVNSPNITAEIQTAQATGKNLHRLEGNLEYYIPLFKHQCILLGSKGAGIFTSSIFDNEMYRIGGLRTLRGVDEESLFATSYIVGTFEYRFLFEENSAFYVFADQSWYEKKGARSLVTDIPLGFGAGVNFETKAGIFTFNYALGKQFDNPLLVRNAKVSFGFRNIF